MEDETCSLNYICSLSTEPALFVGSVHYFNKSLRSCYTCSHICVNCSLFKLLPFPVPSAARFTHGHSLRGHLNDASLGPRHLLPNLGPSNPETYDVLCGYCARIFSHICLSLPTAAFSSGWLLFTPQGSY